MTNEELILRSVGEIVERLVARFSAQASDHETKMAEHRAAFGARTEADAKIIAGLREEVKRLQWENATMHKDAEDGYAEAIKVLGDPIALSKERDALRAEVDFLKTLRPKYKVGDKLESYSSAVTIVGVRTVYDCQTDGAEYPVGHSEDELKERYEQTPKQHPVKVGEWVRRLVPSSACDVGTVARVVYVDDNASEIEYDVERIGGQRGVWFAKNCEPCDPPEATAKLTPKIGDTVRLVTHPERAQVAEHLRTALQWPWISRWGLVGQTGKVVKPRDAVAGTVAVALDDDSTVFARWPIDCLEVVAEATHDTEAGKAAAESAAQHSADIGTWSRKVTT